MLRLSHTNALGIAVSLSLLSATSGIADDPPKPQPKPTSPVQLSCQDYKDQHGFSDSGLTTWPFKVESSDSSPITTSKSGNRFCAKITADKVDTYSVTAKIRSTYWEWKVPSSQSACQTEAEKFNAAVKGFEQQHIDDVRNIVKTQTTNLRTAIRRLTQVCDTTEDKAIAALRKSADKEIDKITEATRKALDDAAQKRDAGDGHTYREDCSCAPAPPTAPGRSRAGAPPR